MSFIDTSVQIDGQTMWPFPAIPVEVADTAATRAAGAAVQILTPDGTSPVTVRLVGALTALNTVQSSPAFGESPGVFGSVPAFYAPAGTVMYRTPVMDHIVTSPAYINLVGAVDSLVADTALARAAAEQASVAAGNAATSAANAATAAQNAGGSGNGTPGGGIYGYFVVPYVSGAWVYTSLAAAQAAGYLTTQRLVFEVPAGTSPIPSPPSWAPEGTSYLELTA